jgi:hypothetical protein
MISELTDDEILEFLMTSDFENEYKPEELKYLLHKWRYFYRVLYGKFDLVKTDKEFEFSSMSEKIEGLKQQITELNLELRQREEEVMISNNRKLSLKERISGKIINRNENK